MVFVYCAYRSFEKYDQEIDPIRLGADLWRHYAIRFDPRRNEVAVRIGPIVNTGQVPLPGSEVRANPCGRPPGEVRVKVGVPMVHTYDAENRIDTFSGPSFKFEPQGNQLHVHFLD